MSRTRKILIAAVIAAVAGSASLWLALPELVRRVAVEKAADAGWEADVGSVEISWKEVVLKDVQLKSSNGWAAAYVREVRAERDGTSVGKMMASGVRAKLKGKRPKGASEEGGQSRKVVVTDAEVDWEEFAGKGSRLRIRGLSTELGGPKRARAESADAEVEWGSFTIRDAELEGDTLKAGRVEASAAATGLWKNKDASGQETTEEADGAPGGARRLEAKSFAMSLLDVKVEGDGLTVEVLRTGEMTRIEAEVLEARSETASLTEARATAAVRRDGGQWMVQATWEGALSVGKTKAVGTSLELQARAELDATGSVDPLRIEVKSATLETGSLAMRASGSYGGGMAEVKAEIPEIGCQEGFDSLPGPLQGDLAGTRMEGAFRASIEARVDVPERNNPEVRLDVKNGCRIKEVPKRFDLGRLARPFTRVAMTAEGKEIEVKSGPGTKYWVSIQAMSRHLSSAVIATEDAGFMSHRGVLVKAVENAIELDVKEGRFARGASTITMQLAKNLWLGREKTAARKLQEAVLATYLEQRWDKGQILEYYLNLAEFAPGIYGAGEASYHYFRTDATQLTMSQSLMMALALPSPSKPQFDMRGEPFPGRLALARRVMRSMRDTDKISDEELAEALGEVPVLGGPVRTSEVQDIKESEEGISPDWE